MRRRTRRGFTLTEIIVAIAIAAIAMMILIPVFAQTGGLFRVASATNLAELAGTDVYERISGDIRFTEALALSRSKSESLQDTYDSVFTVEDGRLFLNGEQVYDDTFYMGCTLEVSAEKLSSYTLRLKVSLTNIQGKKLYENASTVEMLNVKLSGVGIAGNYSGELVNPAIYFMTSRAG